MALVTYLAGAFCPYKTKEKEYNDWRDFVLEKTNNQIINFYDPRKDSNQLCPATFTMDDAKAVLESDVILHYRTKGYEDEGASWEHGIAFAVNYLIHDGYNLGVIYPGKSIIYVDDTNAPWPLNSASASVNFSNLETAVDFLNKMNTEKEEWIKTYYQIVDKDRRNEK